MCIYIYGIILTITNNIRNWYALLASFPDSHAPSLAMAILLQQKNACYNIVPVLSKLVADK